MITIRYYNLAEIVAGIYTGDVNERDCFESIHGEKLCYVNDSLHYVTKAGYVTSLVTVSEDAVKQLYYRVASEGAE